MATQDSKNLITVPKEVIQKKGGVVILSLEQYKKLRERAVPIYYLRGEKAEKLDTLVKTGLIDHNLGKTRKIKSLADLD